jgi:hypothetical protein
MSENSERSAATGGRFGKRAMSMPFALVILIVVIVVTAGVGYLGFQSIKPSTATVKTCSPASACANTGGTLNDVTLFTPYSPGFGQTMIAVAAGAPLSATVGVTGSETIKTYEVAWGDGSSSSGPTATLSHTYSSPGIYVLSGSAIDTKGTTHTGLDSLIPVSVTTSLLNETSGYFPALSTTLSNGTGAGIYPWVGVGATVSVNASYANAPPNVLWTASGPTLTPGSGVTQKTYTHGNTWSTGTYSFGSTGVAQITMSGTTTNGSATLPFTYTWSFFVGASATGLGCSSCKIPVAKSPHPGELVVYEVAPSGSVTNDPAGDYYTVGSEVSENIFQYLIQYNGTDEGPTANSFIPDAATCVPGSGQCNAMYPGTNGLVSGNNYTFVISAANSFYDPATGKSWGMYPSDVMFSMLRQMMYADGSVTTTYPGWIISQAMLGPGNPSYDNNGPGGAAVHYPYNNTPANMLDQMLINDSAFCPAAAMTAAHGCITFNADTGTANLPEPAILDYLAHSTAAAIQACGWYTAEGTGVPGFAGSGADAPCWLPGHSTSTSQSTFTSFVASQGPTSWDGLELDGQGNYSVCGTPYCPTGFIEVGSGPYALVNANPTVGYILEQNPNWQAPAGCAGESYCLPSRSNFVPKVLVYYDDSDTLGIQELSAGYADFAGIEEADTGTYLALDQKGEVGLTNLPGTEFYMFGFNTNIGLTTLAGFDPYPINIQSNSLSYAGLRGLLAYSYPAASTQAEYNVYDGITYGFNVGGFIPQDFGPYYPTNVSFPNYNTTTATWNDPSTSPSAASTPYTAEWFWQQMQTSSSPFYDPQFGSGGYSANHPLHVPAIAFEGDPTHFAIMELWGKYVSQITGGAIVFDVFYVATAVVFEYLSPGSPWALWSMLWFADYAQPFDYWAALGVAQGTYTVANSLYSTFTGAAYNSPSCPDSTTAEEDSFAGLYYWANQPAIPQDCQGVAYNVTLYWAPFANHDTNVAQGILIWNRVDAIFGALDVQVDTEQGYAQAFYAPWINPTSIDVNTIYGMPGGEFEWYTVTGNGLL